MNAEERAWRSAREADALRAGKTAATSLQEALARVGIVIPSLRAGYPVNGNAHVELGGCNADTATKLAKIINGAADALPELRATAP
ncbi:hypothetical protein [Streptomyces sp. WZ-12]|uniref:hypothetical protein n=1 Tax=Streptomyces sp. WZ-12 TaxID=3030210 RepID=UPI002380C5B0|nr:hypothetical protein [Streptomyces sp. WZ-12]